MSQEIVLYNDAPIEAEPLQSIPMIETGVSEISQRKFDRHYYAGCLVRSATVASSSNAHECDICGKTFSSHHALGGHKSSHNTNKRSRDESKNTEKSRNKRPKCFTTSSETQSASSLVLEEPAEEGQIASSSKAVFECDKCHKTFSTYQALGGHKSSHFYNKDNKNDEAKNAKKSRKRPPCLRLFPDSPGQNTSSENVSEDKPSQNRPRLLNLFPLTPGFTELAGSSIQLEQGEIASAFECDKCSKTFSTYQALGGHKSSHFYNKDNKTDEPKCRKCLKLFPESPGLTTSTSYQAESSSSNYMDNMIDLELRL